MIKALILIPYAGNGGKRFGPRAYQEFEERLVRLAGFSRWAGVHGAREFGGRLYTDRSYAYTVSLKSWREVAAFLDLVGWALEHFAQEAIYIEIAGIPEVIGSG